MKKILTILLSGLFLKSFGQQEYFKKGSLLIFAIGRDGIMCAADSRTNIAHHSDDGKTVTSIAYYDGTMKLFVLNNHVLAFSGRGSIDGSDIIEVVRRYSLQRKNVNETGREIIDGFYRYCVTNYSPVGCKSFFFKIVIYVAGYESNMPVISTYSTSDNPNFRTNTVGFAFSSAPFMDYIQPYEYHTSISQLADFTIGYIPKWAENMNAKESVGGKVQVVLIKPQTPPEWYTDKPKPRAWTNAVQERELILSGKLKVTFTKTGTKQKLKEALDAMASYYIKK